MIPLSKFLACVQENAKRITGYQLGKDGSNGKCDCIGLIIGALALAGEKWPGTHGSNWAARYAMDGLAYIPNTDELFLGEIVYKAYEPWDSGYDLPDRYDDSGDGKPVNMRSGPGKTYPLIDQVAVGGRVLVIGAVAGDPLWLPVQYKERIGYMMSQYVLMDRGADEDTEPDVPGDGPDIDTAEPEEQPEAVEMVSIPRETLEEWHAVMEEMARDMRERGAR